MNFRSTEEVTKNTGFYFGKVGAGFIELAVEDAVEATEGDVLALVFGPVDGITGNSPVSGKPLPSIKFVEITSLEELEEVEAVLNEHRAAGTLPKGLLFVGLSQYTGLVAKKVTGGTQPTQAEFGTVALRVVDKIRYLRGVADVFYVTCEIVEEEDGSGLRFNVQPAIYKNIPAALRNSVYVAATGDGTRLVQRDTMKSLKFIVDKPEK